MIKYFIHKSGNIKGQLIINNGQWTIPTGSFRIDNCFVLIRGDIRTAADKHHLRSSYSRTLNFQP